MIETCRSELSHEKHIQDLGRTNQENKTRKNVVINLQDFIYALRVSFHTTLTTDAYTTFQKLLWTIIRYAP